MFWVCKYDNFSIFKCYITLMYLVAQYWLPILVIFFTLKLNELKLYLIYKKSVERIFNYTFLHQLDSFQL